MHNQNYSTLELHLTAKSSPKTSTRNIHIQSSLAHLLDLEGAVHLLATDEQGQQVLEQRRHRLPGLPGSGDVTLQTRVQVCPLLEGQTRDKRVSQGRDKRVGQGRDKRVGQGQDSRVDQGRDKRVGQGRDSRVGQGQDSRVCQGRDNVLVRAVTNVLVRAVTNVLVRAVTNVSLLTLPRLLSSHVTPTDPLPRLSPVLH